MKDKIEKVIETMEKVDVKVSKAFKVVGKGLACFFGVDTRETVSVHIPVEKTKNTHDYIVDYMTAGNKEEVDAALSKISGNYPFK